MADQEKPASSPTTPIAVSEARQNDFVVITSFVETSRREAETLVQPPRLPTRPRRQPGALRGQISLAPDFDTLPADILASMQGKGE